MHTYMATMYMFMSVGICATLYLKIESVEKYLNTMLKTNFQVLILIVNDNNNNIIMIYVIQSSMILLPYFIAQVSSIFLEN